MTDRIDPLRHGTAHHLRTAWTIQALPVLPLDRRRSLRPMILSRHPRKSKKALIVIPSANTWETTVDNAATAFLCTSCSSRIAPFISHSLAMIHAKMSEASMEKPAGSTSDGQESLQSSDPEQPTMDLEPTAEKDFEVSWDTDDAADPHNMSNLRKWAIVILVSSTTVCVCVTSSLDTSTYSQITNEFGVSRIVATLGLSFFIAGLGWGPMVLAPLSEFYGRRVIYRISLPLFLAFLIPCGVAMNIQTMLIARFLDGLAGAAFSSVAGGTVGDMFTKDKLQTPMLIYTASPL